MADQQGVREEKLPGPEMGKSSRCVSFFCLQQDIER
jgi:hypothetical protein